MSRYRFTFSDPPPADAEQYKTLKIQRIDTPGKPLCKAWRGKQSKPFAFYSFRSIESREAWINQQKQGEDAREVFKAERAQARVSSRQTMLEQIQVGTMLHGSWGYDQTNAELWQVVERHGAAVWIQRLACETVPGSEGFMSEMIRPIPGKVYGEKVKKIIGPNGLAFECFTLTPTTADEKHYSSSYA